MSIPRSLLSYVDEEHLRDSHDQEKPAPGLEIVQRLPDMIPTPLAGDDAHLIGAQSLDRDDLFAVVEIFRFHG